jgi:hypothetical protein
MKTIQLNLKLLVDTFAGGSVNKFASEYLNDRSQNLTNWISGEKNPNVGKLCVLFETIPNLSLEWLFRGNGDMFLGNKEKELMLKIDEIERQKNEYKDRAELYEKLLKKEVDNLK